MTVYTVAICEDQTETRAELTSLCGSILTEFAVEHEIDAYSGAELLQEALLDGKQYDLLCLDILMDGESGMELARKVRAVNEKVSILFITGSREFLKDGYEVRPIQYLFKPIQRTELADALQTDLRLHHCVQNVTLTFGGKTTVLPVEEIWYVESCNHDVVLFSTHGSQQFRLSLTELEHRLPQERFCRCHNSFIVNMAHIRQIERKSICLNNDVHIPIGRNYYEMTQTAFIRYLQHR